MNKAAMRKLLEKRFSDLTTAYHRQVLMGKTPRELVLLILRIRSTAEDLRLLRQQGG